MDDLARRQTAAPMRRQMALDPIPVPRNRYSEVQNPCQRPPSYSYRDASYRLGAYMGSDVN